MDKEILQLARKLALKNALDYGSAKTTPVFNKLLAMHPELKSEMGELGRIVAQVVNEVNNMSNEERKKEFEPFANEFKKAEEEKKASTSKPHMELEGAVMGDFAARFPPEPNGYIHIGNVKQAFLSQEFARIYKGKLFLYFDDTNPDKDRQEFVDAIKADTHWLGIEFDKEYYASDSIPRLYDYARQLLSNGKAYVCFCTLDEIKRNRALKKECVHRSTSPSDNLAYFEDMLAGKYKEGEAVVRFKGDMQSENATMRDPVIMRIKSHEHYRQGSKYLVWPTYYFNTPINDSINGVTDVIRSKEYELSNELYFAILNALGLRVPRVHEMARLRIEGTSTHKRELKELISKGIISSYDDPRLVTIAALRRRGIAPEAIRNFVLKFGMSKTDSIISIDMLLAENRKVIDKYAKRLFFIAEPVALEVDGMQLQKAELRLHPTEDLGFRRYAISNKFIIEKSDAEKLHEGSVLCLKDLCCVKVININSNTINASFIKDMPKDEFMQAPKVQWLSEGNYVKCEVEYIGKLIVDGKINENSIRRVGGFVESYANELKEGDVVNFERVGFFKLDSKQGNLVFLSL